MQRADIILAFPRITLLLIDPKSSIMRLDQFLFLQLSILNENTSRTRVTFHNKHAIMSRSFRTRVIFFFTKQYPAKCLKNMSFDVFKRTYYTAAPDRSKSACLMDAYTEWSTSSNTRVILFILFPFIFHYSLARPARIGLNVIETHVFARSTYTLGTVLRQL